MKPSDPIADDEIELLELAPPPRPPIAPNILSIPPDWLDRARKALPKWIDYAGAVIWIYCRDVEIVEAASDKAISANGAVHHLRLQLFLAFQRAEKPTYFHDGKLAEQSLLDACIASSVAATGVPQTWLGMLKGKRESISEQLWSDLNFGIDRNGFVVAQHGPNRSDDAFGFLKFDRDEVLNEWPALRQSLQTSAPSTSIACPRPANPKKASEFRRVLVAEILDRLGFAKTMSMQGKSRLDHVSAELKKCDPPQDVSRRTLDDIVKVWKDTRSESAPA